MKNQIKEKSIKKLVLLPILLIFGLLLGCSEDPTDNPYTTGDFEAGDEAGQPVITSMEPADEALAGVSIITIKGQNLYAEEDRLFVYFNGEKAEILSAEESQLVVKAPNLVQDDLRVQVTTAHPLHSEYVYYDLKPTVSVPYEFTENEIPYAIAINENEEILVSMTEFGAGAGVKSFTPGTKPAEWAPSGAETKWDALKIGADGNLYGTKNKRGIWQIVKGEAPENRPYAYQGFTDNIVDLDFDSNGIIWAVGGNNLYSVQSDKTITKFAGDGKNTAVRVYDGYIYLISANNVVRYEIISATEVGEMEMYFEFASEFTLGTANTLTFGEDGIMYLATNLDEPILAVYPDKTYEELYPGVVRQAELSGSDENYISSFSWGNDVFLYATYNLKIGSGEDATTETTVLKINMQQQGAPHYGRD